MNAQFTRTGKTNDAKQSFPLLLRPLFPAHAKNVDQRTPLSIAASSGHASVVQALILGASVSVNDADVDGITPIHLAASEGYHAVIAALIDEGGKGGG